MIDVGGVISELAGPWGPLACGLVAVTYWLTRLHSRVDNLDHEHHGRVPKIETRLEEHAEDIAAIKTDVAVSANNTEWIVKFLQGKHRERV